MEELIRLRREKALLQKELGSPLLSFEHGQAKDGFHPEGVTPSAGVDYRYMRAVRIQSLDKQIKAILAESIKAVT